MSEELEDVKPKVNNFIPPDRDDHLRVTIWGV